MELSHCQAIGPSDNGEGGLWGRIFATLAAQAELPDDLSIDSTAVRAHRSAHGGKGGRKFRPSGARVAGRPPKSMP